MNLQYNNFFQDFLDDILASGKTPDAIEEIEAVKEFEDEWNDDSTEEDTQDFFDSVQQHEEDYINNFME